MPTAPLAPTPAPPRIVRAAVALASIALGASRLPAQQAADTTALSPVVITATKVELAAGSSTAATTVISGAALRERGIVSVADALRDVAGVAVNPIGPRGSQTALFLRGGNSSFTKVLIDGVPLNAPGGALDLSTLTTDNVERIEIVRGPASVQYGTDAMTGVIQIFTRRTPGSVLEARMGSRGQEVDARVEHARRLPPTAGRAGWHGSAGLGVHRGEGFLPFNNEFRNTTASALAGVDASAGEVRMSASFADATYHYPTTGSGTPEDSNAFTGARRLTLALHGRWNAAERVTARLDLTSSELHSRSADEPDSPGDREGFYSASRGRTTRRTADVQLFVTGPRTTTFTLGAAVEAQRARSSGWSRFGPFPAEQQRFREGRTNRGLYLLVAAGRRELSIEGGVRRELLGSHGSANTGRVGVASQIIPGSVLRASLGTAFKEPAFEEQFTTAFSTGNADLRPERNRSREIGAETRLPGGVLTLGATAFDQRFEDLVQYRFVFPPEPSFVNVRDVRVRGWELEGRTAMLRGFALRGTYTLLASEVLDAGESQLDVGKPLVRRPRRSAALDGSYRAWRTALHATVTRVGARDDTDFSTGGRVRLDRYTRVDVSVDARLSRADAPVATTLTLRGDNVTDAEYENVAGYDTPGRVLYVGLRLGR